MTDILTTLDAIGRVLNAPSTITDVRREICRRLRRALGAGACTILRLEPRRGELMLVEAVGLAREDLPRVRFKITEGVAGLVARTGRGRLVPDVLKDRYFVRLPGQKTRFRSMIVVPMRVKGRMTGQMALTSPRVAAFTADDLRLVQHVADSVAREIENHRLFELTVTDPLTGLYNRRYVRRRLEEEVQLSRRHGLPFAVLMFDVDDFRGVNARHGHAGGDEALLTVANGLRSSLRVYDVAARYGGDEFVVVMGRANQRIGRRIADRIRRGIAGAGGAVPVTLSAGVAAYPSDGRNADRLLKRADQALFKAKRAGKNRVMTA